MIKRYKLPEFEIFLSESAKHDRWILLERETLYALSNTLKLPYGEIVKLEELFKDLIITPEEVDNKERETRHDFVAFLRVLEHKLSSSPIAKFLHYGLTSSDIIDTAQSLLLREINELLVEKIEKLSKILSELSYRYLDVLQVGRTHGRHAEPVSFGYKFAITYQELEKALEQLYLERRFVEVVTLKGSTGTYAHIGPEIQESLAYRLRLFTIFGCTQALPRNRYASYLSSLSNIARILNVLATNLRILAREEIAELSLRSEKGQIGSSSMPHKVNPVTLENISGLTRWISSIATLSLENIELWDERDISHSSTERMSLCDAPVLLGNILERLIFFLNNLSVDKEQLKKNLDLTKGVIASQRACLYLLRSAEIHSREEATEKIHSLVNQTQEGKVASFTAALSNSEDFKFLNSSALFQITDLKSQLKYLPRIYEQIFSRYRLSEGRVIHRYELTNTLHYLAQRLNWYYSSFTQDRKSEEKKEDVIIVSLTEESGFWSSTLFPLFSFSSVVLNCYIEFFREKFSNSELYQKLLALSNQYSKVLILVENAEESRETLKSLFSSLAGIENIKEVKCLSLFVSVVLSKEFIMTKKYYRSSLYSLDYQGSILESQMREYNFKNWTKESTVKLFNWYGLLLNS